MAILEYKHFVANHREIETAKTQTKALLREQIALQNSSTIRPLSNLFCFLVGASAETRLKKILNEPTLEAREIKGRVSAAASQIDQWVETVELSFRKRYRVPNAELGNATIGITPFARFDVLVETLNTNLRPVIELRNKIAHGQWHYPFTSDGSRVDSTKYHALRGENLHTLAQKDNIISKIGDAINLLVLAPPAFDRDFEKVFWSITNSKKRLTTMSFEKYESKLIEKKQRGLSRRRHL